MLRTRHLTPLLAEDCHCQTELTSPVQQMKLPIVHFVCAEIASQCNSFNMAAQYVQINPFSLPAGSIFDVCILLSSASAHLLRVVKLSSEVRRSDPSEAPPTQN